MNIQERTLARHLFKSLILGSDGQAFENIFTQSMKYAYPEFQKIKPWGNVGDRKNDGYIASEGTYYQVFAPEDIRKARTSVEAVNKIKTDFAGLLAQWPNIKNFYFVINDKFYGTPPDCELAIQEIKVGNDLIDAKILTASDLGHVVFSLKDDEIQTIIGFLPDPANISELDYSIVTEVVGFIMKQPVSEDIKCDMVLPDWEEKILFNGLSHTTSIRLNNGIINVDSLNRFLSNDYGAADLLRDKLNEVYREEMNSHNGDDLFWNMVRRLSPVNLQGYQETVIVIMAKYFETCDIFEKPSVEVEK